MITIDADLQNPPEEIPRLVEQADAGYDVVATYRKGRQDSLFRRMPSWIVNKITAQLVGAKLRDYGCMLRAYSRDVIDSINLCQESSSFIPALANTYAKRIIEIEVGHEERKKGVSKYSLFRLLRLNFDLMTGFSLYPIQFISIVGVLIAIVGLAFALFLHRETPHCRPRVGRPLHVLCRPLLLRGRPDICPRRHRRIHRKDLPGGAETAQVHREKGTAVRAVVLAYHEIGYVCLEELIESGSRLPPSSPTRTTRKKRYGSAPPRTLAQANAIPVFDPESLRDPAWIDRIRSFAPDYLFSFYYRHMLPREVLDIPRIAAMNLHGSLLPAFRGRCPVNWVLIKGEKRTGVTLHIMEVKPDAGDIVAQQCGGDRLRGYGPHPRAEARRAAQDAHERDHALGSNRPPSKEAPQTGTSSYYGGRKPEDGLIDWTAERGGDI